MQEHVDPGPWSPKSEACERIVPIHSRLIELGLLDLAKRRSALPYLWPDLRPSGPDGKRGFGYSREFSRRKIALGVGKKTTFHSFRHTTRTILESTDLQERRSEEHTSDLQSLMRISSAVFCLKQKTN